LALKSKRGSSQIRGNIFDTENKMFQHGCPVGSWAAEVSLSWKKWTSIIEAFGHQEIHPFAACHLSKGDQTMGQGDNDQFRGLPDQILRSRIGRKTS
jgi:hypothetical protein